MTTVVPRLSFKILRYKYWIDTSLGTLCFPILEHSFPHSDNFQSLESYHNKMASLSICFMAFFLAFSLTYHPKSVQAMERRPDPGTENDLLEQMVRSGFQPVGMPNDDVADDPTLIGFSKSKIGTIRPTTSSLSDQYLRSMIDLYLADMIRQMNMRSRPRYGRSVSTNGVATFGTPNLNSPIEQTFKRPEKKISTGIEDGIRKLRMKLILSQRNREMTGSNYGPK